MTPDDPPSGELSIDALDALPVELDVERLPPDASADPRILAAWREWLRALATDAEAAIAAGHVYDALAPDARDAWLDALAEDGPKLSVPKVAIYAPLLAVEVDPDRRHRMQLAMGDDLLGAEGSPTARVLRGIAEDGSRVAALVRPLYLSFVQVLSCRYHPDLGFAWVRHDPIVRDANSPADGAELDGIALETTPLKPVVEEMAHAVLAQRRSGKDLPAALIIYADLFNAEIDADPQP